MDSIKDFFKRNKRILIIIAVIVMSILTLGLTLVGLFVGAVVISILYKYGYINEESRLGKALGYGSETKFGKFVKERYDDSKLDSAIKSKIIEAKKISITLFVILKWGLDLKN